MTKMIQVKVVKQKLAYKTIIKKSLSKKNNNKEIKNMFAAEEDVVEEVEDAAIFRTSNLIIVDIMIFNS